MKLAGVTDGFPAKEAGLAEGMVITELDGVPVVNFQEFTSGLKCLTPGDNVTVKANGTLFTFPAGAHPDDPNVGYLGVMTSTAAERELKNDSLPFQLLYIVLMWFAKLLNITAILSLGIGLANLLPLGPVDGGRMLQVSLVNIKGKEKGLKLWKQISLATLLILLLNIFWPMFQYIGSLLI